MTNYIYKTNGRTQRWFVDGKLHRLGGPAYIDGDIRQWCVGGKLHRLDGPAVIDGDCQQWYVEGKRHRLDGPAVIDGDYQAWYVDDKNLTKEEFVILKNRKGNVLTIVTSFTMIPKHYC